MSEKRLKVYIDGDGCPKAVKEILYRAADKRGIDVVLVANRAVAIPKSLRVRSVVVDKGLDVADAWLAHHAEAGDLVVTSDIPLASELVAKGVVAVSARGETYTSANIGERLAMRDFFTEARESGMIQGGGPPAFDEKAARLFANAFDRWVMKATKDKGSA